MADDDAATREDTCRVRSRCSLVTRATILQGMKRCSPSIRIHKNDFSTSRTRTRATLIKKTMAMHSGFRSRNDFNSITGFDGTMVETMLPPICARSTTPSVAMLDCCPSHTLSSTVCAHGACLVVMRVTSRHIDREQCFHGASAPHHLTMLRTASSFFASSSRKFTCHPLGCPSMSQNTAWRTIHLSRGVNWQTRAHTSTR